MSQRVIILEGINGVGKSTYAKALASRLGVPICRPFRNFNTDIHWGSGSPLEQQLKAFGVPVNTQVDDLYVADFLATFKVGAVLDRAMPSAIAYAYMRGEMELSKGQELMDFWAGLLQGLDVTYIWMKAPYQTIKERCEGRWTPTKAQCDKLTKVFSLSFNRVKCQKRQLSTEGIQASDGVAQLCQALRI